MTFWDFETNPELVALFVGQYRSFGTFKKACFIFRQDNKTIHVWGSAQLNYLMYGVPFQSLLKITYEGKKKTAESKFPMKHFKMEILEPPKSKDDE